MTTSASAIILQIEAITGSIATIGSAAVSYKGFEVLETTTTRAAVVIRPTGVSQAGETFGRYDTAVFNYKLRTFIKNTGDYQTYFTDQITILDDVLEQFSTYDDLNSACDHSIIGTTTILESEWNINGQTWQEIDFDLAAIVFNR
ncbi:MAG: hypothetical protein M0R06_01070 [Sphaerochaeta sp.]|jgi:hypothetical protein|nr:hypothetical protein [Sphaerochaeta sp.]